MKMEPIERSETSASNTQTPGNYPEETVLQPVRLLDPSGFPAKSASSARGSEDCGKYRNQKAHKPTETMSRINLIFGLKENKIVSGFKHNNIYIFILCLS
jgi:hypothetical protein